MSSALESSFLADSVLVVRAEIWQEGTVALSTSPEVPRGGHRPGDVVRPGHGCQSNLERLQLTSLPRVHHASLVRPPFTLGAIFSPELSPVLKALGLVEAPSTCPLGSRACGDQGEQDALLPGHQQDFLEEADFLLGLRVGAGKNVVGSLERGR